MVEGGGEEEESECRWLSYGTEGHVDDEGRESGEGHVDDEGRESGEGRVVKDTARLYTALHCTAQHCTALHCLAVLPVYV